jgi:delta 1-pyrroline-5-carboxylate dehydrogenase
MDVATRITTDSKKLNDALARFPRDRAMPIGNREAQGQGEAIERRIPAHGVVVTRVPRGSVDDARCAIAAARPFDKGPWPQETASARARVLLKAAYLIDRDRETLATLDAFEPGQPIAQARGKIEGAADIRRYPASLARELSGESYANLGPDRLGLNSAATRSKTIPRKRRSTSTLARAGAGGSREGPDNFRNREPSSGF